MKISNQSMFINFLILVILYSLTNILWIFEDFSFFERIRSNSPFARYGLIQILFDYRFIYTFISVFLVSVIIVDLKFHLIQNKPLNFVFVVVFSLLSFAQMLYVFGFGIYGFIESNRMIEFIPPTYAYLLIIYAFISISFVFLTAKSNKVIDFYDIDKFMGRMFIPSLITLFVSIILYSIIVPYYISLVDIVLMPTIIGIPFIMGLLIIVTKKVFINKTWLLYLSIGLIVMMILMIAIIQSDLLGVSFIEVLLKTILILMPFIYLYVMYAKTALNEGSARKLYDIKMLKIKFNYTSRDDDHLFE